MATGFAPYILRDLTALGGINYPGLKLTPAGLTACLLENSDVVNATLTPANNGHQVTAKVKYKVRQTDLTVATTDDCDINFVPAYVESDMTAVRFAKTGFHISMNTMSQYMAEASAKVNIGSPPTGVMAEIVHSIQHAANSMVTAIDKQLLADVSWGKNIVSGLTTATTFNIPLDSTDNNLTEGYGFLLNDLFANEFLGTPLIVGSGLFNAHEMQKMANIMSAAQNGVDVSKFNGYKYYPDLYSSAAWANNQIGVFAPGSIHFVDFSKYVGFQAGKIGTSTFFQIDLPVNYGFGQTTMKFDCQLKELDCPTTLLNGYGDETSYERGYGLFISKKYGLFQQPTNAINGADRLAGSNGALRYAVTNT